MIILSLEKIINVRQALVGLGLYRQRLCEIPSDFVSLSRLARLDVSYNELQYIPQCMQWLCDMLNLLLDFRAAGSVMHPAWTYLSPTLRTWGPLSFTGLNELQLLTELDLSGNPITSLAPLAVHTGLRNLKLSSMARANSLFSDGPCSHELAALSRLTHLSLSSNNLTRIPCFVSSFKRYGGVGTQTTADVALSAYAFAYIKHALGVLILS